jgi:hypothetical protein
VVVARIVRVKGRRNPAKVEKEKIKISQLGNICFKRLIIVTTKLGNSKKAKERMVEQVMTSEKKEIIEF